MVMWTARKEKRKEVFKDDNTKTNPRIVWKRARKETLHIYNESG